MLSNPRDMSSVLSMKLLVKIIAINLMLFPISSTLTSFTKSNAEHCEVFTIGKTEEHKIAISNLSTIEDVENYDYTTGYPEKLRFEV